MLYWKHIKTSIVGTISGYVWIFVRGWSSIIFFITLCHYLLLQQIFGIFLPHGSCSLLQHWVPERQVHKTLAHSSDLAATHPPSSVLSYWCSYWNWAQTSANITDEWRQTVPYDSNYCRRGNLNFLILWQGINSHLCWKCGPMLRCGPAMFWCWGSCGALLV